MCVWERERWKTRLGVRAWVGRSPCGAHKKRPCVYKTMPYGIIMMLTSVRGPHCEDIFFLSFLLIFFILHITKYMIIIIHASISAFACHSFHHGTARTTSLVGRWLSAHRNTECIACHFAEVDSVEFSARLDLHSAAHACFLAPPISRYRISSSVRSLFQSLDSDDLKSWNNLWDSGMEVKILHIWL